MSETGVGFPDVTLFPVIAELFEVSIGVLFGEPQKEDKKMTNTVQHERNYAFEPLTDIKITVGNVCNIDVIDGERETSAMTVKGDATFLEFLSVEKENGCLRVCIKTPLAQICALCMTEADTASRIPFRFTQAL